jgi:hypothetical protein
LPQFAIPARLDCQPRGAQAWSDERFLNPVRSGIFIVTAILRIILFDFGTRAIKTIRRIEP